MTEYLNKIKAAKTAARDILRLRWITNLLSEKRPLEASLKTLAEEVKDSEHAVALVKADFRQATLIEHPDLADYEKAVVDAEKDHATFLDLVAKKTEKINEALANIDNKIAKVSNGELKVCYDNMIEKAKELLGDGVTAAYVAGEFDNVDSD